MEFRSTEVRDLSKLTPEEVVARAKKHLIVCEDLNDLYKHFAKEIFNEIQNNNLSGLPTRLILPIGPIGQYPQLTKMIEEKKLSLANCWFFFMDEYCDENGDSLTINHPLSFKRIAKRDFLLPLKNNFGLNQSQVIFPDENNINKLANLIDEIGGIDTCYGGIGIHGHIAFNEPEPNVYLTNPRKVRLNDFTITINSIRAVIGGNLENFPKEAFSLGMKQILNANRIRLYCRNGSTYDWANIILRIALFGQPGDDYPVTYIRNHSNYVVITDKNTLKTPNNII
jgi:glucosamine-6-phosphate deaminase